MKSGRGSRSSSNLKKPSGDDNKELAGLKLDFLKYAWPKLEVVSIPMSGEPRTKPDDVGLADDDELEPSDQPDPFTVNHVIDVDVLTSTDAAKIESSTSKRLYFQAFRMNPVQYRRRSYA